MISEIIDGFNFIGKQTPARLANMAKVFSSFQISKAREKANHKGMPISISIEPTTSCNLRCPECPSGLRSFTRPTGMLDENFYRSVIDELHRDMMYMIFYFQ